MSLGRCSRKYHPAQIAIFMCAYAKLRMLQIRYDLMEGYFDQLYWAPLYIDTDIYYIVSAGDALHDCLYEKKKLDFYQIYVEWFPREACDDHQEEFVSIHVHLGPIACCTAQHLYDENTPGLFKPEFIGTKTVALGCKTYHCINERSTNNG